MNNHNSDQFQPDPALSRFHKASLPVDTGAALDSIYYPLTSSPVSLTRWTLGPGPIKQPTLHLPMPQQTRKSSPSKARSTTSGVSGRRKARNIIIGTLISVFLALAAIAAAVWLNSSAIADVTLYQVVAQDTIQYIGGGGVVFPRQRLDLSYPIAERVVNVLVKAGDAVAPNQPLIRLDPTQLNAQVQQAADNMAAAQAYLNTVSASGNAVSIAQAQQQYNLARNKYNALVAQTSSPLLHNGDLVSPMHGIVTSINIDPGEVFSADTTLLTIMDQSMVVVHVKIPLSNLGQISPSMRADVTPSALPDRSFQGMVTSIIPQADPQTDTFEIWVTVDNAQGILLPGMSAFARVHVAQKAFVVPRLAVLNPDHGPVVFVVQNHRASLHRVQVVGRSADIIFIGAGLSSGDQVVLVGQDQLHDGQNVRVRIVESWQRNR